MAAWLEQRELWELWPLFFRNTECMNLSLRTCLQLDYSSELILTTDHQRFGFVTTDSSNHRSPFEVYSARGKTDAGGPRWEKCFNKSYSVSYVSSNHSNNGDTAAASKTGYSIWSNVTILQCLSLAIFLCLYHGFRGILMNIYAPLQLNARHEMKYCAAWGAVCLETQI